MAVRRLSHAVLYVRDVSRTVAFYDGHRVISTERIGFFGLYAAVWHAGKAAPGRHVLRAVVTDRTADSSETCSGGGLCVQRCATGFPLVCIALGTQSTTACGTSG